MSNYFFSKSGDELAKLLMDRVYKFQDHCINTGIAAQWKANKDFYENKFFTEFANLDFLDIGEQSEELATSINHFRNIIRHTLNPIQAVIPSFTVTAANGDVESIRSAEIGKQTVEYYNTIKRLDKIDDEVMEYAAVYGQGFHVEEWNSEIGREIVKEGKLQNEGDFDPEAVSVWDCFYDFLRKGKKDWYIFRRRRNKYDIAALFQGEKAKKIEAVKTFYLSDKYYKDINFVYNFFDSDDIYVYTAYHRATPSMPNGKYCLFVGDTTSGAIMLYESENVYRDELPIFEVKPGRYLETGFGFTDANIIRTPQIMLNNAISATVTNMQSAVKSIWSPSGEEVTIEESSTGRNLIQSRTKPEVLDLYTGDANLLSFIQFCVGSMETLSAQNAVVRGNVSSAPNLKSGIALQTVIAMGQQYSQSFDKAKKELFEDVNTFRLKVLSRVATTERMIDIVGKQNISTVKKFLGSDLKDVSRVIIQEVNPIANTYAGRIERAFELLKIGKINLSQYNTMVHTGNLDLATSSDDAMVDYIAQVKDRLLTGKPVQPIMGADHMSTLKEVGALLLNIDFALDPKNVNKVAKITQFLTQTMDLMRNGDELSNYIHGGAMPTQTLPEAPTNMEVPPEPGQIGQQVAANLTGGM